MKQILFLSLFVLLFSCQNQQNTSNEVETDPSPTEEVSPEKPSSVDVAVLKKALGIENISPDEPMAMAIEKASTQLVKGTVENGEGLFDVYKIMNAAGEELGNIYPIELDSGDEAPFTVEITNPSISTPEGIKVGDTYQKLMDTYEIERVTGSEIEGWTYAQIGYVYFRLSAYNPNPEDVSVEPTDDILLINFSLRD